MLSLHAFHKNYIGHNFVFHVFSCLFLQWFCWDFPECARVCVRARSAVWNEQIQDLKYLFNSFYPWSKESAK